MNIKECFVEECRNSSENAPHKIFIRVPLESQRRKKWFLAVNFNKEKYKHILYACEDHFELEKDVVNWMFYKTMGSKVKLKPEVVPHKNLSINTINVQTCTAESQLSDSAKKRRMENLRTLCRTHQNVERKLFDEPIPSSSRSTTDFCVSSPSGKFKSSATKFGDCEASELPMSMHYVSNIVPKVGTKNEVLVTRSSSPDIVMDVKEADDEGSEESILGL